MRPFVLRFAFLLALIGVTAHGCSSDDPAAPPDDPVEPISSYPLSVGNHWTYDRMASFQIAMLDDPSPDPPDVRYATGERTLVGTETFGGVDYFVEEELFYAEGFADTLATHLLFRQDEGGLYVADLPIKEATPAITSPREYSLAIEQALHELGERTSQLNRLIDGGFVAGDTVDTDSLSERTRLLYPLEPGTTWTLSEVPPSVAVVEEIELLELPAGTFPSVRIRIDTPVVGEDGWAFVWYGECGRLKTDDRIVIMAMDALTGEIAIITQERRDALADLTVVSPGACTPNKKKEGAPR